MTNYVNIYKINLVFYMFSNSYLLLSCIKTINTWYGKKNTRNTCW